MSIVKQVHWLLFKLLTDEVLKVDVGVDDRYGQSGVHQVCYVPNLHGQCQRNIVLVRKFLFLNARNLFCLLSVRT